MTLLHFCSFSVYNLVIVSSFNENQYFLVLAFYFGMLSYIY